MKTVSWGFISVHVYVHVPVITDDELDESDLDVCYNVDEMTELNEELNEEINSEIENF